MKYQSTRGGAKALSFEEVVLSGYAPDGGMYMPMEIPKLSEETLKRFSKLSYPDVVKEISMLFIGDEIPRDVVDKLIDDAFSTFKEPASPIRTRHLPDGVTCMEMYHGKSLAFKDLSMSCTAQFMHHLLEKRKSRATVLIATSGDTGSSALEAISDIPNVDIVVLLPKNRISQVQELQMTSVVAPNCHVIRADGTSDDTDVPIKKAFGEGEGLADKYKLGSLNSVNWCRTMVQIAHHFYIHFVGDARDPDQKTVTFIPSAGLGNAAAGCIAHEMGLPNHMVCAVTNDALSRAVYENDYSVGELNVSLAPAMNIQVPYNWERLLYVLSGLDTDLVKKVLDDYEIGGRTTTPPDVLKKMRSFVEVVVVSDEQIVETTKRCYDDNRGWNREHYVSAARQEVRNQFYRENGGNYEVSPGEEVYAALQPHPDENDGYIICPHTATAFSAAYRYENGDACNRVVFGVASPEKFPEVVVKAGIEWKGRNLIEELKGKTTSYTDWGSEEDWYSKLKTLIRDIHAKHTVA